MPAAWDYTTGQSDVIIAVLDTGVSTTTRIWRRAYGRTRGRSRHNGIDDDGNGFIDDVHGWNFADGNNQIYDDHGHGTHVAGIAAARINNSIGIAGMAGGATIMPVDVFPLPAIGTYEDLIRAIIYATDNGADVINMSLGATSYSRGEEAAVDYAWNHGVVVVAAAGNTSEILIIIPPPTAMRSPWPPPMPATTAALFRRVVISWMWRRPDARFILRYRAAMAGREAPAWRRRTWPAWRRCSSR